jgi:SecD/SecF fusion protein
MMMAVVIGLVAASITVVVLRPTVLGLDLQGGVEVVLQGRATAESEVNDEAIQRSIEVIRNRVDRFGVTEPEIQKQGDDQIIVALPGADNPEQVVEDLIRPAQLNFYDYEENLVGQGTLDTLFQAVKRAQRTTPDNAELRRPAFYLFGKAPQREFLLGPKFGRQSFDDALEAQFPQGRPGGTTIEEVPAGLLVASEEQQLSQDSDLTQSQFHVLQNNPGLSGNDIERAFVQTNTQTLGDPTIDVAMDFTDEGGDKFQDITAELAQRGQILQTNQTFAVILDNEIVSRPFIDFQDLPTGISGGRAVIQGNFSTGEARRLADQINSGAIPIELEVISQQEVSATLGAESLRQGLIAGLVGLALVLIFLIAYYRVLGAVAALALLIYASMLYAAIELVPVTLTLPGIAGIILTIGVASDANVVIFERVREEARAGRTPRTALLNGYKRGISAIIDANVVTLATAVILFLFATAGVRGFAFTLFIGVLLSFFTAVFATRAIFGLLVDTPVLRDDRFMGLKQKQPNWNFDFVGRWKMWLAISFIPIIIGMGWIGINGLNLGLDFESGSRFQLAFEEQPSETAVREAFADLGLTAKVQETESVTEQGLLGFQVTTSVLQPEARNEVEDALQEQLGEFEVEQFDLVGPTFGRQIVRNAITAIILSFIAMVVYLTIRFEYKLALPALLSVVQDVLLSISIYAFTGREVTAATVAALLTVLGYSLYDVVIVFDRIRENVPILRGWKYRDIVNRSVAEVLSRSLITTFTTLVPIIALFFFGGETLKDFAFALAVGIFSGGASSIVISAPLAALWKEREDPDKQAPTKAEKRAKLTTGRDSDVADVDELTRAEMMLDQELAAEVARAEGKSQIGAGDVEIEIADQALQDALPDEEPPDEPEADPDADAPEPAEGAEPESTTPTEKRPRRARSGKRRHQNVRKRRRR